MDVAALIAWYDAGHRPLPWRETTDPWRILVSEVMLQQTQAPRVVPFFHAFLERFPRAQDCAHAPVPDLLAVWRGLGYPRRALALQRAAQHVHARGWPDDLQELPGVGPYTAAAVGSFAFGRHEAAVDTNVRRVLERHDGRERPPRELQARADALPPPGAAATFNQAMMELGATVCTPRRPRCGDCPVRAGCHAHARGGPPPPTPTQRRPHGPGAPRRFEDTDRFARGAVLRALLDGADPQAGLDRSRYERVAESLVADGLATRTATGALALP